LFSNKYFGNGKYVMTGVAQVLDYGRTGGLVYHESHGARTLCGDTQWEDIFVGQRVRGIGQCCTDVVRP
jgi:hypothetical protein